MPPVLNKPAIATTAAAAAAAANTSMPTYGVSKIIYSLSLENTNWVQLRYIYIYCYVNEHYNCPLNIATSRTT